jgi:hypothetical protein
VWNGAALSSTNNNGTNTNSSNSNTVKRNNTPHGGHKGPVVIDWVKIKMLLTKLESTLLLTPKSPHLLHTHSSSISISPSVGGSSVSSPVAANPLSGSSSSSSTPTSTLTGSATTMNSSSTVHYLLLRTDTTTPLITSANWNDLDLNQTDSQYIFAKLQLAARQLAATLQNSAANSSGGHNSSSSTVGISHHDPHSDSITPHTPYAQAIHMRGQKHVFSYYALGEYSLILHREELAPAGLTSIDANSTLSMDMDWSPSASSSTSASPDMICNDGSIDFEKEAVLKSILQQVYVSLNGYPESVSSNPPATEAVTS